jgi:hypothetical protein
MLPRHARMSALRAATTGVRAAWRAPSVIASGLGVLIAPPAGSAVSATGKSDAPLTSRVAHAAIARLARLAPGRWLNTCLYRSVAECLALRALALPARVVIGVGTGVADDVIAHAWVECEGVTCLATRGQAELETMTARARRASSAHTGAT